MTTLNTRSAQTGRATHGARPAGPPRPSIVWLALEPARGLLDWGSSLLHRKPRGRGDGHPVIVYPGLGAGALTTLGLRQALRAAGFSAHDWGQGTNRGPHGAHATPDRFLAQLEQQVRELAQATGRRVSLVGWSLGGIYARELAKRVPHLVRRVVTLGTPFNAPPNATHAGWLYKLLSGAAGAPSQRFQRRLRQPPPVPTTSIYSKTDGVVAWQGCLQPPAPGKGVGSDCDNVEISSASHLGLANHPAVLEVLVDRLARPEA